MEIVFCVLAGSVVLVVTASCIGLMIWGSQEDSEYTFACPNCGEKFNLNWKKIFPSRVIRHLPNHRFLRCPRCKKIDNLRMVDKEW